MNYERERGVRWSGQTEKLLRFFLRSGLFHTAASRAHRLRTKAQPLVGDGDILAKHRLLDLAYAGVRLRVRQPARRGEEIHQLRRPAIPHVGAGLCGLDAFENGLSVCVDFIE